MVKQYIEESFEGESSRFAVEESEVANVVAFWQRKGHLVRVGAKTVPYSARAVSGADRDATYTTVPMYNPPVPVAVVQLPMYETEVSLEDDGSEDDGSEY